MKTKRSKKSPVPASGKGKRRGLGALGVLGGESRSFLPSNAQLQFFFYYFCYPFLYDDYAEQLPTTWHDTLGRRPSISDVCNYLQLSRSRVYKWFADPDFCAWWNAQLPSVFSIATPKIAHQFLFNIRAGKVSSLNLLLKFLGKGILAAPPARDPDFLKLLDKAIPDIFPAPRYLPRTSPKKPPSQSPEGEKK